MARPATGTVRWDSTAKVWTVRVTLADGRRSKPVPMTGLAPCSVAPDAPAKGCGCGACTIARDSGERTSKKMRDGAAVDEATTETVNEWSERWLASRKAKGLRSTAHDRVRYTKWISPLIGTKPITAVTRRDIEELVERLDAVVAQKGLSWKTAINIWGVASKMFADACRSKVLGLRVREDNPARDVQGPDRGSEKSGPYVFPAELRAIMECRRIPSRWKRLIAIAVYLYIRRGELAALEWADVNLDRGYVHIHRSVDDSGLVKPTKTGDTRKVPIDPALRPVLEAMREAANGEGRVFASMPPREEMAKRLRRYVQWACEDAGIPLREEILADDETRRPLVWHDLRHSGITWRAVRGDDPLKIQRAAGHTDLRTTQRYINEAQTFEDEGTFGEPFEPLDLAALMAIDTGGAGRGGFRSGFAISDRAAARKPGKTETRGRPQGDSKAGSQSPDASTSDARSPEKTEANATSLPAPDSPVLPSESTSESPSEAAIIERAIDRLTRALGTAADDAIPGIVAERRALREELRELREREAGDRVVSLFDRARKG